MAETDAGRAVKRTYRFARSIGTVSCRFPSGEQVNLPVIPGIFKHPLPERLPDLLQRPNVAYKYALEAIRQASWPVLRQFPRDVLCACIDAAHIPSSRRKAILFLLG
jgi:hypothetical protein